MRALPGMMDTCHPVSISTDVTQLASPPSALWLEGSALFSEWGLGMVTLTVAVPFPAAACAELCSVASPLSARGRNARCVRCEFSAVTAVIVQVFAVLSPARVWRAAALCFFAPGLCVGLRCLPGLWLFRGDCSQTQARRGAGCYQGSRHFHRWQSLLGTFSW